VAAEDQLPWTVPAELYIKEAMLGLRDGATPPGARCWALLKKCLAVDAASGVCEALFWISIMVIFPLSENSKKEGKKTLSTDYLRDRLAKCWLPLTLEAKKGADNFGTQEWVLGGLPHVYAQIIFRLLVDIFEGDRQHMINHGDAMIDKLSQLAHYELTGFQACEESHRRTRKQLFVGRVINMPHVNQYEFLKGQKRQEELQHRVEAQQRTPLSFGSVQGDPLDHAQLEHVMDQRAKALNDPMSIAGQNSQCWALETSDLSVDNYAFLTQVGQDMYFKQLQTLDASQMHDKEVDNHVLEWPDSPNRSEYTDGSLASSPATAKSRGTRTWTSGDVKTSGGKRSSNQHKESRNLAHTNSAGNIKKSMAAVMFLNRLSEDERKKEEAAEAELQKQRELLMNNLISAQLPEEHRNRELYTTWVSPVAKRLKPGAEDRFMLKKPSAEARHLQMAPPSPIMAGSVQLKRPKSMPSMSPNSSPPKHLQRRVSKDKFVIAGEIEEWSQKDVCLEPPKSISNEKVLERLQTQLETCQQGSFGEYMRNFDILTGQRKQHFSDKRLRIEEAAYVKKMEALVRGTLRRVPTAHGERPQGPPSDAAKFRRSREFVALFSKSEYS